MNSTRHCNYLPTLQKPRKISKQNHDKLRFADKNATRILLAEIAQASKPADFVFIQIKQQRNQETKDRTPL